MASNARYFFCRLLPPRQTFAQDMSPAEAETMKAHVAYWTELLQRDSAVIFGPVADPKGIWGVGIIKASSDDEMKALRDADPAMQANLGFQYEVLPMLQAVVRE